MGPRTTLWLIIIGIAIICGIVGGILVIVRKRHLQKKLTDMGFNPSGKDDALLLTFHQFGFFQKGKKRTFENVHRASLDGLDVVAFDYAFDLRDDPDEKEGQEEQTVFGFQIPDLKLPMVDKRHADRFHYHGKGDLVYFYMEKRLLNPRDFEVFVARCLKTLEKLRRDPPKPLAPPVPAQPKKKRAAKD